MIHKSSCEFTIKRSGSDVFLALKGSINETCNWPDLSGQPLGHLHIDLQEVRLINSFGCRDWANWITGFKASKGISLHNCPEVFTRQLNIFETLVPKSAVIQSFYVNYICLSCSHEQAMLLERDKDYSPQQLPLLPKSIPCPNCHAQMDLETTGDNHFQFLNNLQSA